MKNYINQLNQYIENSILNYIDKLTKSFYPKEYRIEQDYKDSDDDEDPILFI